MRQWQNLLAGQLGHESLMACRSILFRILRLAEDEGAIAANPVRKVPAPRRRADPERIFAEATRRVPYRHRPRAPAAPWPPRPGNTFSTWLEDAGIPLG